MSIDDFAPNLSFFFSNGMDPEYAVIGRVARRIWARAMRERYQAGPRSQMLKYHVQTSGRSLHAREISFNDIRTTLQALYALFDNCNSLHTNAYDEALTTPTEESVRRAVAIQLIINRELGLNKIQKPLAGLVRHRVPDGPGGGGGLQGVRCRCRSVAGCSARWRPCTSAARSRRSPLLRDEEARRLAADRRINTFLSGSDAAEEHKGAELIRSTEERSRIRSLRCVPSRRAMRRARRRRSARCSRWQPVVAMCSRS